MISRQYQSTSIVGLLSERDIEFCRRLSADLNLEFGEYIPHFTIVSSKQLSIGKLSDMLTTRAVSFDGCIHIEGVYFRLETSKSRLWVGLIVRKDEALRRLQQELCRGTDDETSAEDYFPHITLGCIDNGDTSAVSLRALAAKDTSRQLTGCQLAVAEDGEYGKVTRVVGAV